MEVFQIMTAVVVGPILGALVARVTTRREVRNALSESERLERIEKLITDGGS